MAAEIESIVGRYLHLTLAGRPQRVYFEEAGKGIPWFACTPPGPTPGSTGT